MAQARQLLRFRRGACNLFAGVIQIGLALPAASGIRGWNQKADVGLQPVGDGLFYQVQNSGTKGAQRAQLTLMRWTGDAEKPLAPVTTLSR